MGIPRPVQEIDSRYRKSLSATASRGEQGERASVEGMGCTLDEEHSTALFIPLLDVIAYNHFQPPWAGFQFSLLASDCFNHSMVSISAPPGPIHTLCSYWPMRPPSVHLRRW